MEKSRLKAPCVPAKRKPPSSAKRPKLREKETSRTKWMWRLLNPERGEVVLFAVEEWCASSGTKSKERFMHDKKTSVFAIYTEKASAERGVRGLMNAGFDAADISVLLPENLGTSELGT